MLCSIVPSELPKICHVNHFQKGLTSRPKGYSLVTERSSGASVYMSRIFSHASYSADKCTYVF